MPQRIFFILVVSIFLFSGEILGQEKNVEKIPVFGKKLQSYDVYAIRKIYKISLKQSNPYYPKKFTLVKVYDFSVNRGDWFSPRNLKIQTISNHYPLFCRLEKHFEKATSIPFRFRLGSLAYTDYLEQKPNSSLR
jgi:hypothetical protein